MTPTRPDPMEMWFTGPATERFADFKAEAEARSQSGDPLDRAAFAKLPSVQRMLTEIETSLAPTPNVLNEYLAVLHAAFGYWRAGGHLLPMDREAIEPALGEPPAGPPVVPFGACLLQFPERWFWLQIGTDQPHEPLDSILVCGPATAPRDGDEIAIVTMSGVRSEREGVSQVSLAASPAEFAVAHGLLRRPPFAPLMAGGADAGLKSIGSQAELLHLTHVALRYAARYVTGPNG